MKLAPLLLALFALGLSFSNAVTAKEVTIVENELIIQGICPSWPECKPIPNEQKPPVKKA